MLLVGINFFTSGDPLLFVHMSVSVHFSRCDRYMLVVKADQCLVLSLHFSNAYSMDVRLTVKLEWSVHEIITNPHGLPTPSSLILLVIYSMFLASSLFPATSLRNQNNNKPSTVIRPLVGPVPDWPRLLKWCQCRGNGEAWETPRPKRGWPKLGMTQRAGDAPGKGWHFGSNLFKGYSPIQHPEGWRITRIINTCSQGISLITDSSWVRGPHLYVINQNHNLCSPVNRKLIFIVLVVSNTRSTK